MKSVRDRGGLEDVIVRTQDLPNQIKSIMIALTSYGGESLAGDFKVLDDREELELLFHRVPPTPKGQGMLVGVLAKNQKKKWDFIPAATPVEATKPYDAHARLKLLLLQSDFVAEMLRNATR
jgi:hypothetical protein